MAKNFYGCCSWQAGDCCAMKQKDCSPMISKNMRLLPLFSANQSSIPNPLKIVGEKPKTCRRWSCESKKNGSIVAILSKPDLNRPVGVAFGTFNVNDFMVLEDNSREENDKVQPFQAYATCLLAFGETFVTPEDEWNSQVLNRVLQGGKELLIDSMKANNGETLTAISQVLKCYKLCMNTMEVDTSEPIVTGMMQCRSSRVYSFGVGVSMFMQKFKCCLVNIEQNFFLIWKRCKVYFLFDCYGRAINCQRNTKSGKAALLCACSLASIDVLLTYMGKLDPDAAYSLYEIRLKRLLPCCEQLLVCSEMSRIPDFQIVGEQHAIIEGHFHIATDCFKECRYKQGLAVGLISAIYSKIDAPCTWNPAIVDKILIVGYRFYKEWTQHNAEKCLLIQDIPAKIIIGQFMCEIVIFPTAFYGTWILMPDYKVCEITRAIKNFFIDSKCLNLLIQIDRKAYALWKRNGFYYLFDAYPRNLLPSTIKGPHKNATLHMFSTLKLLCCVFTQEIIGVPTPSPFFIHVVKILNMKKVNFQSLSNDPVYSCVNPNIDNNISETTSLNESIYDISCEEALKCTIESYDIGVCDLDVPPISETQNMPSYNEIMGHNLDAEASDTESLDGGEGEEEEEEEGETDDDEDSDGIPRGKGKGKRERKGKGTGKDEGSSDEDHSEGKGKANAKGKSNEKEKSKRKEKAREKEKSKEKGKAKANEKAKGKNKGDVSLSDENENDEKSEDDIEGKTKSPDKETKDSKGKKEGRDKKDGKGKKDEKEKKDGREKKAEKDKKDGKDKTGGKDAKRGIGEDKSGDDSSSTETDTDTNKKGVEDKKGGKDKKDGKNKNGEKNQEGEKGKDIREGKGKSGVESSITDINTDQVLSSEECEEEELDSTRRNRRGPDGGSKNRRSSDGNPDTSGGSGKSEKGGGTDCCKQKNDRTPFNDGCITPPGGWPPGSGCIPNSYPGYTPVSRNLAVIGSENGTYQSLCQLIRSALKVTDRMLTMTAWGNYVVFKNCGTYLLYDGCTCNPCRFRNIDLSVGTAGLLCFDNLHDLILEILKGKARPPPEQTNQLTVDDICKKYC